MARRFKDFDCVNIQFEYGTLGMTRGQIVRRFRRLAQAAPALTVTFHTVHRNDPLPWSEIGAALAGGKLGRAIDVASASRQTLRLGKGIYDTLRHLQQQRWVSAIVHTYRDMQLMRDAIGLRHVFHHPLSFLTNEMATSIRQTTSRADFAALAALPADAKLIGTFGFLSSYKGFEVAIRALRLLPDDFHLLVFGGVHPQNIKKRQAIDPYVQSLLREGNIGDSMPDDAPEPPAEGSGPGNGRSRRRRRDLTDRIHFLGVLPDDQFMAAMAVCDVVALPYIEVGQSSSGPVSIALEMGCRVLASRTAAFRQLARYHPGQIRFFDIGNFAELAGLIRSATSMALPRRDLSFNPDTNRRLYMDAMFSRGATAGTPAARPSPEWAEFAKPR
jgi:glycosyltransferase involved in cell wall biosynthesis